MKSIIKTAFIAVFLAFAGVVSAQTHNPPHKPQIPFRMELLQFKQDCELADSFILEKFQQQIMEDYQIEYEFRADDIQKIIDGIIIIPPSFQRSMVKVIRNPNTCKP